MFTFGHAIGVDNNEWDIESLEHDLDSPAEDEVVPAVIVKLLYALTYDRKIKYVAATCISPTRSRLQKADLYLLCMIVSTTLKSSYGTSTFFGIHDAIRLERKRNYHGDGINSV